MFMNRNLRTESHWPINAHTGFCEKLLIECKPKFNPDFPKKIRLFGY